LSLREQCFDSGMDGYVTKPIQPQELFDVLERVQQMLGNAPSLAGAGCGKAF
jgi:CheY-like chemotaxis protein